MCLQMKIGSAQSTRGLRAELAQCAHLVKALESAEGNRWSGVVPTRHPESPRCECDQLSPSCCCSSLTSLTNKVVQ